MTNVCGIVPKEQWSFSWCWEKRRWWSWLLNEIITKILCSYIQNHVKENLSAKHKARPGQMSEKYPNRVPTYKYLGVCIARNFKHICIAIHTLFSLQMLFASKYIAFLCLFRCVDFELFRLQDGRQVLTNKMENTERNNLCGSRNFGLHLNEMRILYRTLDYLWHDKKCLSRLLWNLVYVRIVWSTFYFLMGRFKSLCVFIS